MKNNNQLTSQEQAVQDYLKKDNVSFSVSHIADRAHEEWPCDEWLVSFKGHNKSLETFNYKTDTGHRFTPPNSGSFAQMRPKGKGWRLVETSLNNNSKKYYVRVPCEASILYCLLLDAQAIEESFDNWADNFGYNSDSIEHLNIYRECCKNAQKLLKCFTLSQIESLKELLVDY